MKFFDSKIRFKGSINMKHMKKYGVFFTMTALFVSSCGKETSSTSGGNTPPTPKEQIQWTGPTRIDAFQKPVSITIQIANVGQADATALKLDPLTGMLSISKDTCSTTETLKPQSTCSFDVTLTPETSQKKLKTIRSVDDQFQDITLHYVANGNKTTSTQQITYSVQPAFAAFPSVVSLNAVVADPITHSNTSEQPVYGSSATVVLYNRSNTFNVTDISFPDLSNDGITVSKHACDISGDRQLKKKNICAFELIYKPKAVSPETTKTIAINYKLNGQPNTLSLTLNYSAEKKINTFDNALYGNLLDEMKTKKAHFAFINNCSQDLWLANKPVPTFGLKGIQEKDQKIEQGKYFVLDDAYASSLFYQNSAPKDYSLSMGFPSLNFYAKFGCDENGTNCKIGQVSGPDTLTPNQKCSDKDDCQADTFSKFEVSFGCTEADQKKCSKNPSKPSDHLAPGSFMDGTFLDGFSYNMAFDVFPSSTETNEQCFGVPDSKLDVNKSLTDSEYPLGKENLTSVASQWSIMRTDAHNLAKWTWTDDTPPLGWAPDEYGSPINLIGQENWNKGVADLRKIIATLDDNGQSTNATFNAYNDIDPSKTSFLAVPKQVYCFDSVFDGSLANKENEGCKDKTKDPTKKCKPTTQIDLTSHSLLMQQRDASTGEILPNTTSLSVAGPGQMLTSNRHWGGLGLGNQCLYIGGHAFEVGALTKNPETSPFYPTYFDRKTNYQMPKDVTDSIQNFQSFSTTYNNLALMYLNPYNGVELAVSDSINDNAQASESAYVYQQFRKFCVSHPEFCPKSQDQQDGVGGLAPMFGNMGPVNDTNFVKYVRKNAPGYYSWQYDDYNATRICNDSESKRIVIFCGKDQDTPKYPVSPTQK